MLRDSFKMKLLISHSTPIFFPGLELLCLKGILENILRQERDENNEKSLLFKLGVISTLT